MEHWIQTFSGTKFWPLKARMEDVHIVDIAHSLSMQCRYNGHCDRFYSIAEHSVIVSHYAPEEFALEALLHDAVEAYLCDVPRPIKPLMGKYKDIEEHIHSVIAEKFGLPLELSHEVKRVDESILKDEAQTMMRGAADWDFYEPALGVSIDGWLPGRAKIEFLRRYMELTGMVVKDLKAS